MACWAERAKPNIEPLPDNVGVAFVHPNIHFIGIDTPVDESTLCQEGYHPRSL
jgi:hypothetical protein